LTHVSNATGTLEGLAVSPYPIQNCGHKKTAFKAAWFGEVTQANRELKPVKLNQSCRENGL
jgi:hypothetical protein